MTQELSPKPPQLPNEAEINELLENMDDFSDEELSMLISQPPVTPRANKESSGNEPMDIQTESDQNPSETNTHAQAKKIKLATKAKVR